MEFARASVGLEGFTPSALCLEHARYFIEGEIDLDEFLKGSLPVFETPVGE
ncbi:antitoxin VbhA family protein [Janthinobacterium sp. GB4P2]|uniref:antitoxin VbhA family protein n=1 Tax=Janthinobacterium sp. GB4P2 TaxID=3424189 RepID=UPI003F20ECEB